jgi:hypothetical protein
VISPRLANVYLHWFERAFHASSGPAQWAKAKIVRYADAFVILASRKAMAKARETIRQLTSSKRCSQPVITMIGQLNAGSTGWTNYFGYG